MALDINTKKMSDDVPVQSINAQTQSIADLYWGGAERRITGLTVRIIGVNIVALIILFLVFLYMGQYHTAVIENKLETISTEALLVSTALSESVVSPQNQNQPIDLDALARVVPRLSHETRQNIYIFDRAGRKILSAEYADNSSVKHKKQSNGFLKIAVQFIAKLVPRKEKLPRYPALKNNGDSTSDYPDVTRAYDGTIMVSAWSNASDHIFLSTTAPLERDNTIYGAILSTHTAYDIEEDISTVWRNILSVFAVTFLVMIALSIYLAGVIAYPIKRLARAAEGVRRGALSYTDIPDYSGNHDEVGELSIALRQMTKALSDRMDAIEYFAADVAHELKNPLTSLRSAVETLHVVKKKSDREKLFNIIEHDLERINRLITDISRSSRIDAQLSRAPLQRVDVLGVIVDLLDVYRTPLERQNNDLCASVNNVHINIFKSKINEAFVWGQSDPLYQVFENLLTNALSFSNAGDVIDLNISVDENDVIVTVTDQGGGIAAKNINDIFDRFYSRRPEAEKYGEHSGLGLAICQQIVAVFDGRITAENIMSDNDSSGARFTVTLKAA